MAQLLHAQGIRVPCLSASAAGCAESWCCDSLHRSGRSAAACTLLPADTAWWHLLVWPAPAMLLQQPSPLAPEQRGKAAHCMVCKAEDTCIPPAMNIGANKLDKNKNSSSPTCTQHTTAFLPCQNITPATALSQATPGEEEAVACNHNC